MPRRASATIFLAASISSARTALTLTDSLPSDSDASSMPSIFESGAKSCAMGGRALLDLAALILASLAARSSASSAAKAFLRDSRLRMSIGAGRGLGVLGGVGAAAMEVLGV